MLSVPSPENPAENPTHGAVDLSSESLGSHVVRCLAAHGVSTVFGIPGTHNIEVYRGLTTHGLRHVSTRHEQGAVYAADAYARTGTGPGIVVTTSGPGLTNALTGLANAHADSVPVLVISPGASRGTERRDTGDLHETRDQRAGAAAFVQDSIRVETKAQVTRAIEEIFHSWATARPRPFHLEIPLDVIGDPCATEDPADYAVRPWLPAATQPSPGTLARAAEVVRASARPLVIAGGGAADGAPDLVELAEHLGAPVYTTSQGKGTIPETHPLSAGVLSGGFVDVAPLHEADVVLAIGTEFKDAKYLAPDATVVRFDIDAKQLHSQRRADLPVLGDAATSVFDFLRALEAAEGAADGRAEPLPDLPDAVLQDALGAMAAEVGSASADLPAPRTPEDRAAWVARVREDALARLAPVLEEFGVLHAALVPALGDDVVFTGDSSQVSYSGTALVPLLTEPRRFFTTDGYATLGYALPAAIGAKIARPEADVVCLVGDGAFVFSVQELLTAAQEGLGLAVVVYDNHGYREILGNMTDAGVPPIGVDFGGPDYAALATAMHCGFAAPQKPEELSAAVHDAVHGDRPVLIHVTEQVVGTW